MAERRGTASRLDVQQLIKYYGFNPVVKRTVADYIQKATGKRVRVAKGIVSLILQTNPTDGGQQWVVDDFEATSYRVLEVWSRRLTLLQNDSPLCLCVCLRLHPHLHPRPSSGG